MTQWLTDMVWVGNMLFPRWFVLSTMALALLALVLVIAGVATGVSWLIDKLRERL